MLLLLHFGSLKPGQRNGFQAMWLTAFPFYSNLRFSAWQQITISLDKSIMIHTDASPVLRIQGDDACPLLCISPLCLFLCFLSFILTFSIPPNISSTSCKCYLCSSLKLTRFLKCFSPRSCLPKLCPCQAVLEIPVVSL